MILISVGTLALPFKRLVDQAVDLFKDKKERIVIQSGAYKKKSPSANIVIKPYFSFPRMLALYKRADLVISSCGEASVYLILTHAKNTPVFVPRFKKYGEHLDNQQLLIAKFLEKKGLAYIFYQTPKLSEFIKRKRKKNTSALSLTSSELGRLVKNLHKITVQTQT